MLTRMKEPHINVANYTTLLKDVGALNLQLIKTLLHDFDNTDGLYDTFMSMYYFYEINDKDEDVFIKCVSDVYDEHKVYFKELLATYNKQYDISTGNKRITTRADTSDSNREDNTNLTTSAQTTHYDLPNKQVSSPDGYVDDINKDNGQTSSTSSIDSSNTYNSTVTTSFDNQFLDLKKQYINQLRNVYHEFAERFSDCFLKIYS